MRSGYEACLSYGEISVSVNEMNGRVCHAWRPMPKWKHPVGTKYPGANCPFRSYRILRCMAGFSETAMIQRLQTLTPTSQSIQTLSMWVLHHQKKHADAIVQVWLKEVRQETQPSRLISLLYLANDVIQNSRKQCPDFMTLFFTVLEPAFRHISIHADSQVVVALKKIVNVFKDRQIYSTPKIERLVMAVTSSLKGIHLIEFNIDLSRDESSTDGHPRLRMTPITPTTPPLFLKQSSAAIDSPQLSGQTTLSPEAKKAKLDAASFDFNVMVQTTDNLLQGLKKLEESPSADAETRQLIASFPVSIANPSFLKSIKNETEARQLLAKIREAEPVVKEYCKRLSEEMAERRNVQRLLTEFADCLRAGSIRNDQMLSTVAEKFAKLIEQKSEVQKHFESLPDLSQMPSDAMVPLPSLGELFKNTKSESVERSK
ncbi:hypothetical protein AB6A40_000631 [Gnathostoma spinigerum]|uniref:CID domain-containing protein n=1 Tax=Gnathostoma spinigerum TaxID=75299 RepID=A0ABD6EB62_9BILA